MRQTIAALLGAIYLLVIALPAYFALTCTCHAHAAQKSCCRDCVVHLSEDEHLHNHLYGPAHRHLEAKCSCNHSHDNEQTLYIASTNDLSSELRCVVINLLPALLAENTEPEQLPAFDLRRLRLRVDKGSQSGYPPLFGLRAPPVCA